MSIPVIKYTSRGSPAAIQTVRKACEQLGFFVVEECLPLFPPDRFERTLKLASQLFDCTSHQTKENARTGGDRVRGYFSVGDENVEGLLHHQDVPIHRNAPRVVDFKEGWEFGRPGSHTLTAPGDSRLGPLFSGKDNVYPLETEMPDFEPFVDSLYSDLLTLSMDILGLLEKALEVPAGAITGHCSDPCTTLRFLHYWPIPPDRHDTVSIGAHRDYGLITILIVDDCGGLEVMAPDGETWIPVPVPNCGFIVNIGDIMMQWTGGRFKSNVHRVIHRTRNRERYSIPFFVEPNLDTVIRPDAFTDEKLNVDDTAFPTAEAILERYYVKSGLLKPAE